MSLCWCCYFSSKLCAEKGVEDCYVYCSSFIHFYFVVDSVENMPPPWQAFVGVKV